MTAGLWRAGRRVRGVPVLEHKTSGLSSPSRWSPLPQQEPTEQRGSLLARSSLFLFLWGRQQCRMALVISSLLKLLFSGSGARKARPYRPLVVSSVQGSLHLVENGPLTRQNTAHCRLSWGAAGSCTDDFNLGTAELPP